MALAPATLRLAPALTVIVPFVWLPLPKTVVVAPLQKATTSFAAEGLQAAQTALWSQMSKAAPPTALNRARLRVRKDARPDLIWIKEPSAWELSSPIQKPASKPGRAQQDVMN